MEIIAMVLFQKTGIMDARQEHVLIASYHLQTANMAAIPLLDNAMAAVQTGNALRGQPALQAELKQGHALMQIAAARHPESLLNHNHAHQHALVRLAHATVPKAIACSNAAESPITALQLAAHGRGVLEARLQQHAMTQVKDAFHFNILLDALLFRLEIPCHTAENAMQ